jgi:hypothetical protein
MSLTYTNVLNTSISNITEEALVLYDQSRPDEYNHKAAIVSRKLNEVRELMKELQSLDLALQDGIKDITIDEDDIIDSSEFPIKVNDIDDGSLIIYIKNAQLYRMYKPNDLGEFRNHSNTVYKHNGPIYEVARDKYKQKLMIVLIDEEDTRLETMQTFIVNFLKQYPRLAKIKDSDITIFQNGHNIEFLVNDIQLKNLEEKQEFIDDFISFMHLNGETAIAEKIQLRPPPSKVKGVKFYELPLTKHQLSGTTTDILDQLITTPANNSTQVLNIVVNNIVNIDNRVTTTHITNNTSVKTIKAFCKYLYDEKPEWYKENTYVGMHVIDTAYREYFDDTATRASISRVLKGKIFNASTRIKGITSKKLFSFSYLKKQC